MNRGKYIVIEGAEGVGKTTMVQMVAHQLQAAGLPVKIMREPDSQNDLTARAIRHLTQDPRFPMNTRTEVLLYNAARAQSLEVIRSAIANGVTCLVDRSYLTTLAIQYYGRGDVPEYDTINEIINFAVGDMQPDLMVVLDAPVGTLRERVRERYSAERFDNLDDAFLERVRAGYLWEAKQRNLPVVYAIEDVDTVFKQVWQQVTAALAVRDKDRPATEPQSVAEVLAAKPPLQHLPAEPPITTPVTTQAAGEPMAQAETKVSFNLSQTDDQPSPAYFLPKKLSKKALTEYKQGVDNLLKLRAGLIDRLKAAKVDHHAAARLTLPVAVCFAEAKPDAIRALLGAGRNKLGEVARAELHETHNGQAETLQLVDFWPKSELNLVSSVLYPHSNLSFEQLADQIGTWAYEQKADILARGLATDPASTLAACVYTVDALADYQKLLALQAAGLTPQNQNLTPRYGYDVPEDIEAAGLSDMFEACFDASLQLHSSLQAAGFKTEAQLVTLLGHKARFKLTVTGAQLLRLLTSRDKSLQLLLTALQESIAGVHPLVAATFLPKPAGAAASQSVS